MGRYTIEDEKIQYEGSETINTNYYYNYFHNLEQLTILLNTGYKKCGSHA